MAKNKSIIQLSGKIGDKVFVNGRSGNRVRTAPKKSNKPEPSRYSGEKDRTPFINLLAGQVKRGLRYLDEQLTPTDFYRQLLSLFRVEPETNRLLMLQLLKGHEINPGYPLSRFNPIPQMSLHIAGKKVFIELTITRHPSLHYFKGNCYCFEIMVLAWGAGNDSPFFQSKKSIWIYPEKEELPLVFAFEFSRPDHFTDYLVGIHESIGENGQYDNMLSKKGMLVVEVDSFDESARALLEKKKREAAARQLKGKGHCRQNSVEAERVAPKRGSIRNKSR